MVVSTQSEIAEETTRLVYAKATVTRQKEYACERLTRGEIQRVGMPQSSI